MVAIPLNWIVRGCVLVLLIVTPSIASAQERPDEDEALKERIRDLERDAGVEPEARTLEPAEAGAEAAKVDLATPATLGPPLLREGAYITGVAGKLGFDDKVGFWVFTTIEAPASFASLGPTRFVMLPCAKLAEMQRMVEASESDVVFKLTGRVYAFENANYVLPLAAPVLERYEAPPQETKDEASMPPDPVNPAERSTEDLIRDIQRDVSIARSLADAVAPEGPRTDGPETLPDEIGSAGRRSEGTLLIARRGRVMPTETGGWRFIFAGDGSGRADAPLPLLPCMLLERIEREYQSRGGSPDLLMSGEVLTWNGRNFLLPSFYRLEDPQRNLKE